MPDDFEIQDSFNLTIDDYRFEKLIFTYNEGLSEQKNRNKDSLLDLKNLD